MTKLLLFGSPTCAPCFALKNKLDHEGINYEYINVYDNPELASMHDVWSTPTAIFTEEDSKEKVSGKANIEEVLEHYKERLV